MKNLQSYSFHREALEQSLRLALGTSQPALRQQALEKASGHLIHPRLILDSPLFAENHPWRHEALLISDAFEAVTNGMEEPGVLDSLEDLPADSLFQPWRHLILALHFFHEGLDEGVLAHLNAIGNSPVAELGKVLLCLTGKADQPGSVMAERLVAQVNHQDPLFVQLVQDVAEGLETDNEDLFWDSFAQWLDIIAENFPQKARSAVLWAWNQLEWRSFDERTLLDLGSSLWGQTESYRLAALGTLPWDGEGAALLWLRFLISAVRDETLTIQSLQEAFDLLEDFREAALECNTPPAEWHTTWQGLSRAWNREASVRSWHKLLIRLDETEQTAPLPLPEVNGQLDLFS